MTADLKGLAEEDGDGDGVDSLRKWRGPRRSANKCVFV